jgi:6-phosphofructokinase 2
VSALVFALNPAVDCEWRVDAVRAGEKNEIVSEVRWPGGKGINVARWLRWLKIPARLFLPLGGVTGRELAAGLQREGIRFVRFPIPASSRVNVVVTPEAGPQYRFNQTVPRFNRAMARRLVNRASQLAARPGPVVVSGTLAFGAPDDSYARIAAVAARVGNRFYLDCDRTPFRLALAHGPFLVKPNEHELAQWAGRSLPTLRDLLQAARALSRETGGWVLLSRGAKGAVLVRARDGICFQAAALPVSVRNTVGAGDAMLAGAIAAVNPDDPSGLLRWAVATGCAATEVAPGKLPSRRRWRELLGTVAVAEVRS